MFLKKNINYLFSFFILMSCLVPVIGEARVCGEFRDRPYMGIFGGTSFLSSSISGAGFHPGYYIGGCIGYACYNPFRIEGEVAYQRQQLDNLKHHVHAKGRLSTWMAMANILFDWDICAGFRGIIGGGVGGAHARGEWSAHLPGVDGSHFKTTFSKQGFAWQAILGLSYPICESAEIGLEYRYFNAESRVQNHKFGFALKQFF